MGSCPYYIHLIEVDKEEAVSQYYHDCSISCHAIYGYYNLWGETVDTTWQCC